MNGLQVHDVQFDYYGRRLATCSSDRTIKVRGQKDLYTLTSPDPSVALKVPCHFKPVFQRASAWRAGL